MKKLLAAPMILFLLLGFLISPCQAKETKEQLKQKKQIISLMPYMRTIAKQKGASFHADLTDAKQYAFVKARLAYFGKTEKNSPKFFASLEEVKKKQSALKKLGQSTSYFVRGGTLEGTGKTVVADPIDENHHSVARVLPSIVSNPENPNLLKSEIVSTVQDGTDMTYVDIIMRDESGIDQLGNPAFFEEYGDGTDVRIAAVADYDWMVSQYPDDIVTQLDSMQVNVINGQQEPPRFLFAGAPIQEVSAVAINNNYTREQPVDSNGDQKIMLCLNRAHTDCDYPMDQNLPNHDTNVSIPFKGEIRYSRSIEKIFDYESTDPDYDVNDFGGHHTGVYVYAKNAGGTTVLESFYDRIDLINNPDGTTSIRWDIPRNQGTFPNATLYARYENVDWFIKINAQVNDRGRVMPVQFSAASAVMDGDVVLEAKMPPLEFAYSCIAEGTLIRLGDGRLMPIEKIANGAKIMANGAVLSVVDTSVGIETIPMVRITDSKGNSVLLTESHPVLTVNRGIIWANEVKEGDRVKNENGTSSVRSVTTEMFGGKVYNVKLDASKLKVDRKDVNAIYANDILVGDLDMQAEFEFKNEEERKDVLSRIPEEWHQDYLNSLNR